MKRNILILTLILFTGFVSNAQIKKGDVLIKNGTVLTVSNGTLNNTDVLVQNGKISKIGKNLSAPRGVNEIDATGKFVMPGIIDAHSHIALSCSKRRNKPSYS